MPNQKPFTLNRASAEEFVDEALEIVHADVQVVERKLYGLIYRIPREIRGEFMEILETFKDELGSLIHYLRGFTLEFDEYCTSLH